MKIELKKVKAPEIDVPIQTVLSDETMLQRRQKIANKMKDAGLDFLVVYGDLEHGSNFEYLTGFLTRFEESLLVLSEEGDHLIAGNENLNKAVISRLPVKPHHYSPFSLPMQPDVGNDLRDIFSAIGMKGKKIGVAGWKSLRQGFDLPHFIMEELCQLNGMLTNCTGFFIDAENGARVTNNANEIVHYEYGASLASKAILETMDHVSLGMKEKQLAEHLNLEGQRNSVVTICAAGKRFEKANLYPSEKTLKLGDTLSLTVGYKGGLQSRAAYVANDENDLAEDVRDYLEVLAIPYFKAIVTWLEHIRIGMKGRELYNLIETVLPKETYHWHLNPGHLCADEEWLSSNIYDGSEQPLQSGMILQFDIIPSMKGYGGTSVEGGIVLADEKLRQEIASTYPDHYERFEKRRKYMIETLGIQLSKEVLPMGNADAYYRPYLLSDKALVKTDD